MLTKGNVYVAGETFDGLDGNSNSEGWDLLFIKYNSSGTKLWTQQLSISTAKGVVIDSLGNVYVFGATNVRLDGNINAGCDDLVVIKYNSSRTSSKINLRVPSRSFTFGYFET